MSVFFITLISGCYLFTGGTIDPNAKTLTILYFQNNASLAGPALSQQFTDDLKEYMISQSGLSLVNKGGDIQFEGAVTGYSTAPVAIQSNDQAALNRLTITVNVKYSSRLDEKKNFEQSFSRFADYSSTQNLASVEAELVKNINSQLVQDIFNKAFNNW